jgi:hypothetical protein
MQSDNNIVHVRFYIVIVLMLVLAHVFEVNASPNKGVRALNGKYLIMKSTVNC